MTWDDLDEGKYRDETAAVTALLAAAPLHLEARAARGTSRASCRSSASPPARA